MPKPYMIEDWKRLKSAGWNVPEGGILPPRPKAPPAPPAPPKPAGEKQNQRKGN